MRFNQIRAIVQYNTVYECHDCGVVGVGATVRDEIDVSSPEDLAHVLRSSRQHPANMPFGWHSNGTPKRDTFHCGCADKK